MAGPGEGWNFFLVWAGVNVSVVIGSCLPGRSSFLGLARGVEWLVPYRDGATRRGCEGLSEVPYVFLFFPLAPGCVL